jgi:hypothetical protein
VDSDYRFDNFLPVPYAIWHEHGVVLAPPAAKNIGGRSFQECSSHFIPRRQQSPSDTATKQKRNKRDGFGVLLFEGGSADLPLDWQVRISLDRVQMGGPSRFFPGGISGSEGPKATAYLTLNK